MSTLNTSQVLILQAIAKNPSGLTRDQIMKKAPDAAVTLSNLGPVLISSLAKDTNHQESLYKMGLVRAEPTGDEKDTITWTVTAKGAKLAPTLKTLTRTRGNKIPPKVLDPILRKFKVLRTYGLELYTDSDIKEIRTLCGEDYELLGVDSLRQQIVNRRKQGAFASSSDRIKGACERVLREFGPDATVLPILTPEQVVKLQEVVASAEVE